MPTVSIAMATFNGARYVQKQLDSFAAQTLLPDELVVTDDCSTDQTVRIVEDFAQSVPFSVRLVRNQQNLGLNRNFASALSRCSGDIIFISDQDDCWLPEKIAVVVAAMSGAPERMVAINDQYVGDITLTHKDLTYIGRHLAAGGDIQGFGIGCCTALRRDFLSLVLPIPDITLPYDNWIHTLANSLGSRLVIREALQIHRTHETNLTETLRKKQKQENWRSYWRDLAHYQDMAAARLEENSQALITNGALDATQSAIATMRRRAAVLRQRISAIDRGLPGRLASVIVMLSRGDYRLFSGWKSAVRDLTR